MQQRPHCPYPTGGFCVVTLTLRRLTDVPFASLVAVLGINSAVTLFVAPGRSSAASALISPIGYAWATLYGIGGLLILAGIANRRANVEAAGCIAFAGGALINAMTTLAVYRWAAWNLALLLLLFSAAAITRTRHLIHGRVLVLVNIDGRDSLFVKDQ
jgi:peptidoglycan/LPS O-acetylase OafA/YrhL